MFLDESQDSKTATINLILDQRRKSKTNTYPLEFTPQVKQEIYQQALKSQKINLISKMRK